MAAFTRTIPDGDTRERSVCDACGYVAYENPKVVVGSVVAHEGQVLLCRRAIEPGRGLWTLPAGYLELGETAAEGARREALEEAHATIVLEGVLALFDISRIGQMQVLYRASFAEPLATPLFEAGEETLEAALFAWDAIPWDAIAFPSVRWALRAWHAGAQAPLGAPATNPAEDARGTEPPRRGASAPAMPSPGAAA